MINLNDHIKKIDGMKLIPLEIAQAAVAEAYNSNKLDEAMDLIQKSIEDMNESLNDALKDD